jgi:hypothetical protein
VHVNVSLPEALVLFALDDEKGTVHPAAGLALDFTLRGAVLSELRLRGCLQSRSSGDLRYARRPHPPPGNPVLRDALDVLIDAPSPAPVSAWMKRLAQLRPTVRNDVVDLLSRRGVLDAAAWGAAGLERRVHRSTDRSLESGLREQAHAALDAGAAVVPRLGLLVALTVSAHLDGVVFGHRAEEAESFAGWVADRDAVVRAVAQAVAEAEGRW